MLSMKEEGKILYEAPVVTVVEVKTEAFVCQSPLQNNNSINDWIDGGTIDDTIYI